MDADKLAIKEAAVAVAAGMRSMDHLVYRISSAPQNSAAAPLDCREITEFTVSKFNRVISLLNRTGHARFRRAPSDSLTAGKDCVSVSVSVSPQMSSATTANSSFLSSVTTGEGSVSNGKGLFLSLTTPPAVPAEKPPPVTSPSPLPPKKLKCDGHDRSGEAPAKHSRCHCAKRSRKARVKSTIRVPAISSKMADIPPDEYSWRKYGQKPIKGSPYPRGYYKCSTFRGCPARKHVERATDDPSMLIVTYENDHRHAVAAAAAVAPTVNSQPVF